ncbi:MAG TPA: diguanylate cyclase [Bryobacteraceae bacterium]|jgi:diguanylate cyclase (GGDEF)-like protein|nr:diguanylate cyclase [Bryobacteraceae bacterium]
MISLRKQIDAHTQQLLDATSSAYHAALTSVGTNAERALPGVDFPISSNLAALRDRLRNDVGPETMAQTQDAVDGELSQWSDSVERHLKEKANEFREMMLVMATTAQNVTARDKRYAGRFREITSRLNEIGNLSDISAIRRSLMMSAAELEADVKNMEADGQKTIAGLEATLEGYKKQLAETERKASIDALTGLINRRGIETAMSKRCAEKIPFCVILLDLNGFKKVNDMYGHLAGDDLLKGFSSELQAHFRAGDIIGRWGGDEFIIVTNGDPQDARNCVERVRKWAFGAYKVKTPNGSFQAQVSASVGIAAWDLQEDIPTLIGRADEAMYSEKPFRAAMR